MELEQIGIGQLHWSTANYAPSQELALWDGLVAMYEKVAYLCITTTDCQIFAIFLTTIYIKIIDVFFVFWDHYIIYPFGPLV